MSDISPELVERMVQLVRDIVEYSAEGVSYPGIGAEALSIGELLPKPVDTDLIEARKICADYFGLGSAEDWLSGVRDDWIHAELVTHGVKRGRELAESSK